MERTYIKCHFTYKSFRSDRDGDASNPMKWNNCKIASNDPHGYSIIQQLCHLITLNNVDPSTCDTYLTKFESDLEEALKAYQNAVEDQHEIEN